MLNVIQFQTFYIEINLLMKYHNGKEDKRSMGITEVYSAPLVLFNSSFGQVTPTLNLSSELEDKTLQLPNIIKVHKVVERNLFASFSSFLCKIG